MRRTDREAPDRDEILKIIEKCDVCRLALADGDAPYIVPMNFGYEYKDGKLTLYFHGAGEGRKHDIINRNPRACFEMDCSHRLIEGKEACGYTMEYESVIGNGEISLCAGRDEKIRALNMLMKTYVKDKTFSFSECELEAVTVFKLEASDFTGKRLSRGQNPV